MNKSGMISSLKCTNNHVMSSISCMSSGRMLAKHEFDNLTSILVVIMNVEFKVVACSSLTNLLFIC